MNPDVGMALRFAVGIAIFAFIAMCLTKDAIELWQLRRRGKK
jgi:hypothetical protein